jgi:hypothetical protein
MTHVAKGIGDVIVQNTPPRLTAAQAEEKFGKQPGQVWDAELQEFVALGHALVVEQMGRQVDLAANLQTFKANRDVVIRFVQGEYFEEAKYVLEGKDKGNLIPGQLGDYYKVPGSDQKALTKRGASKIKQLFRWSRGAARRVAGEESKEYCSAMIEVPIVDHLGRTVGAGIGACNTAEKAFTSQNAIKKYGGWCEWDQAKHQLNVTRAPDYRGALHDVTSKATKRADTQATIVAAALEEIFTVARDDEGDSRDEVHTERPVFPNQPASIGSRRLPKAKKGLLAKHGGKTIAEVEKSNRDELLKIRDWAKTSKLHGPVADTIDEYLALLTDEQVEEVSDENLP